MTLRTLAQGESGKEPEYLRRSALGNIFGSILVSRSLSAGRSVGLIRWSRTRSALGSFMLPPVTSNSSAVNSSSIRREMYCIPTGSSLHSSPYHKLIGYDRMENTKGHGPIADFARIAGVTI